MKALLLSSIISIVFLNSCYVKKNEFPTVLTMDSVSYDGTITGAIGSLVVPEYSKEIAIITQWMSTKKGWDITSKLIITNDFIKFIPTDPADYISFKGLKNVELYTSDIKNIYVIIDDGFKYFFLVTKQAIYKFKYDGSQFEFKLRDFHERVDDLVNTLREVCKNATYKEKTI